MVDIMALASNTLTILLGYLGEVGTISKTNATIFVLRHLQLRFILFIFTSHQTLL
jgi:hypothetical protein